MTGRGKQSKDRFIFVVNKMDDRKKEDGDTEQTLDRIRAYLKKHGINNPNLFPAAALPALNIRLIENGVEVDEDTIDETEMKVRKLNRNETLHFENYASLPSSIRGQINESLSVAKDAGDANAEALIHTSVMDFDQIEIERKFSINAKVASVTWNKNLLNIIDTPGYTNFLHETKCALSAVDGAVIIASAITGVKAETIRVWQYAEEYNLSKLIFINKMDKERADFYNALGDIEKAFGIVPLPIFLPIGKESSFKGIIDLVRMKALIYPAEPTAQYTIEDIPEDLLSEAEFHRQKLIEAVSETDDNLIEKYLEGAEFTETEIRKGLREGVVTKRFVPVFCGSAIKNIGSKLLLEGIIDYLPSPLQKEAAFAIDDHSGEPVDVTAEDKEFAAYVFKTFADPYAAPLTIKNNIHPTVPV